MTHMLLMSALGSYGGCRNGFLADGRSDSTIFPKPASTPDTFENHMQILEEVEFLLDHIKLSTIAKITGINSYEFPFRLNASLLKTTSLWNSFQITYAIETK